MDINKFDHFFFSKEALENERFLKLKLSLPPDKVTIVEAAPFQNVSGILSKNEFDRSKKNIYFAPFKGQFFKRCPGSKPGLACCNYFVLNLGLQCDMNCSYCYLQSYINSPVMNVYTNIDKALEELHFIGQSSGHQSLRIGTGEVIDSLSLDPLTLYSRDLISFFKEYPNWKLEFKTKTNFVDQFQDLGPAPNTIVSWSINPQNIIESEEIGTASLEERLTAAEKCLKNGVGLAFHIDPMIWHPNWEENYEQLVHQVVNRFSGADLPFISVGALRYQPQQKNLMRERFGMKSLVTQAEMFPSHDGKLRYDSRLRTQMYDFVVKKFKENNSKWNLFFCMESPETWLDSSFKSLPKKVEGLENYFKLNKLEHLRTETAP